MRNSFEKSGHSEYVETITGTIVDASPVSTFLNKRGEKVQRCYLHIASELRVDGCTRHLSVRIMGADTSFAAMINRRVRVDYSTRVFTGASGLSGKFIGNDIFCRQITLL
ncbi:MAG: hypothetical protein J5732_09245 [Bacteroidaceae bacterium]|nr:hypothetical protein [Bacteroidaceae bacterium]